MPTHSSQPAPLVATADLASDIVVRELRPGDDTSAFRTLNEEWITHYFALEEKDLRTLGDPETCILRQGGHILMADCAGASVGCVALIVMDNGVLELSKMAVAPTHRGRGIGRRLLGHAIALARSTGATSLFLGSNRRLASAVHLYESVGFEHVPPEQLPPMPYTRADVFMRLVL